MKTLVVYFSLWGTTERVARELADALGADLERVVEARPRAGVGGVVRAVAESLVEGAPAIRPPRDPSRYDLVVIGTPVWAEGMASPIRSYLFRAGDRLPPRVAFFGTVGGHGGEATLRELRAACGADDAPGLVLRMRDVQRGRHAADLAHFARRLRAEATPPPTRRLDPAAVA